MSDEQKPSNNPPAEQPAPVQPPAESKPEAVQVLVQELAPDLSGASRRRRAFQTFGIPLLAILTGLILGAIFIVLTSTDFYAALRVSFGQGIKTAFSIIGTTYGAWLKGAFGDFSNLTAYFETGDIASLRQFFYPITEGLVTSTPYIFGGLSVALAFRAGLFNIGAEGQIFLGAIFAAYIGYAVTGVPAILHLPLALLAGALGGFIWGFIPGFLKARTGAHEVITTIMLNYTAYRLSEWLLNGPMKREGSTNPISPFMLDSARLPRLFEDPLRMHWGFFVALGVAFLVYWFLWKTKWGFDFRAVGSNPSASRYAGMKVATVVALSMGFAGALSGMAGGNEVLGVTYTLTPGFSSGYGFDSIAIALLGSSHPLGVVLAALLFGFMRSGATSMMLATGIPIDIVSILQALILGLVAAPGVIRTLYRLKAAEGLKGVTLGGK
ncbi:MAG: ABC transporter permease [Anaerolineales bacterium]|jgi:simple sugar transport system permease protein|nr:ABC transporter permease [Anaerolineales bacterium]